MIASTINIFLMDGCSCKYRLLLKDENQLHSIGYTGTDTVKVKYLIA